MHKCPHCNKWPNEPTPPKSSEPEKVINLEPGDWWSGSKGFLFVNRGDKINSATNGNKDGWNEKTYDQEQYRLTDSEGDARAAELGYTVKRAEKVEAGAAKVVGWEDGDQWYAYPDMCAVYLYRKGGFICFDRDGGKSDWMSFPIPSEANWDAIPDSVGDALAAKNGYTIIRKPTPASDSVKGERDTANPAASAKVEDGDIDEIKYVWNGVNTTPSYREDFLFNELLKLKREVSALKAVN